MVLDLLITCARSRNGDGIIVPFLMSLSYVSLQRDGTFYLDQLSNALTVMNT